MTTLRAYGRRRRGLEQLEPRLLLACDWTNPANPVDVTADGFASPLDAVVLVNDLKTRGPRQLDPPSDGNRPPPYLDVNCDGFIAPDDVNAVITELNGGSSDPGPGVVVGFRLDVTDAAGNSIRRITPGKTFEVRLFVQDRRATAFGVFAAYADVVYASGGVVAVKPDDVEFGPRFGQVQSFESLADRLNDIGATAGDGGAGDEELVLRIPFQAVNVGMVSFQGEPANDSPIHDVLLNRVSEAIAADQIDFGEAVAVNIVRRAVAMDDIFENQDAVYSGSADNLLNVLVNDSTDPVGGTLTLTETTDPAHGTVDIDGRGTPDDPTDDVLRYTPADGFLGTDTFTYTVREDGGETDTASVSIQVVRQAIAANDDFAGDLAVLADSTDNSLDVLANDSTLPVGGELTITLVTEPANGSATIDDRGTPNDPSDDQILYTPDEGFVGTDSFGYTVQEKDGHTDQATVTVRVIRRAVAVDDDFTGARSVAAASTDNRLDVLANDSTNPSGGELTITAVTDPVNGTASIDDGGTPSDPRDDVILYTPDGGFTGTDVLTYTVREADGHEATARVTIEVGTACPWQNAANHLDVNGDGNVFPQDALILINNINALGARRLPQPNDDFQPPPYLDVNCDGLITPIDVLIVINDLNAN